MLLDLSTLVGETLSRWKTPSPQRAKGVSRLEPRATPWVTMIQCHEALKGRAKPFANATLWDQAAPSGLANSMAAPSH
jgi:hypothetical protein